MSEIGETFYCDPTVDDNDLIRILSVDFGISGEILPNSDLITSSM